MQAPNASIAVRPRRTASRLLRIATAYGIAGWLLIQVSATTFPVLGLPDWSVTLVVALVALGLPLALVLAWAWPPSPSTEERSAEPAAPADAAAREAAVAAVKARGISRPERIRSIAVVPFANLSADADQEYFSDGVTEELLDALSRVHGLRVPSRTSSFAFKGRQVDIRDIGERLGVDAVLEGSIRRANDRLRISVQLVDVVEGYRLWSEQYDRQLADVFAVQEEIASNVVRAVRGVLREEDREAIRPLPTVHVRAYEDYLRGRQLLRDLTREPPEQAREFFRRATETDPGYAPAYAGLAEVSVLLHLYWTGSPADAAEADRASLRALELAPDLAEAHACRGLAHALHRRYAEADAELDEALRLDPTLFEAHYYAGRIAFSQGRREAAVEHFEHAAALRPEDYQSLLVAGPILYALGREADGRELMRRGLERVRRRLALLPDDVRAIYLGAGALAYLGERDEAMHWGDRALSIAPHDQTVLYNLACMYAQLHEDGRALDCLEEAVATGFSHGDWIQNDDEFAPIRDHPRFAAILDRL